MGWGQIPFLTGLYTMQSAKQLDFIQKSKNKFGNRYTYENTLYVACKTDIIITCRIHGDFNIKPTNHLSSAIGGCRQCGHEKSSQNNSEYIYSENGKIVQTLPLRQDTFIARCKGVHGDKYDYSQTIYKNSRTKFNVTCSKHGAFQVNLKAHIHREQGCPLCKYRKRGVGQSTDGYIEQFNQRYNNAYKYIDVNTETKNVIFECATHGEQHIKIGSHLRGVGCYECFKLVNGYVKEDFIGRCNLKNVQGTLYFVRIFSENESFLKIGITSNSISHRLQEIKPQYNFEIIKAVNGDPAFIYDTESSIRKLFSSNSYKPLHYFGGHTECFTMDSLSAIKAHIDNICK